MLMPLSPTAAAPSDGGGSALACRKSSSSSVPLSAEAMYLGGEEGEARASEGEVSCKR